MKTEHRFIAQLEQRAREQQRMVETEMIPAWAKGLGGWLAVNPWRVMVPLAGMLYAVCRMVYGQRFGEFILGLFGGFA